METKTFDEILDYLDEQCPKEYRNMAPKDIRNAYNRVSVKIDDIEVDDNRTNYYTVYFTVKENDSIDLRKMSISAKHISWVWRPFLKKNKETIKNNDGFFSVYNNLVDGLIEWVLEVEDYDDFDFGEI